MVCLRLLTPDRDVGEGKNESAYTLDSDQSCSKRKRKKKKYGGGRKRKKQSFLELIPCMKRKYELVQVLGAFPFRVPLVLRETRCRRLMLAETWGLLFN